MAKPVSASRGGAPERRVAPEDLRPGRGGLEVRVRRGRAVTEGAEVPCSAEEGLRATAGAIKVQESLLAGEALAITDADLSSK